MLSNNAMNLIVAALGLASLVNGRPQGAEAPLVREGLQKPPALGLGTWFMDVSTKNTTEAIANAFKLGFRHVDGAVIYENQRAVGQGIKEGMRREGLKREDIWITSKLWSDKHNNPEAGIQETLRELGQDYIDLYLMHFPFGETFGSVKFDHVETWKKMEKLIRPNGPTRYIGIANFGPQLLDELLAAATIKPLVHQFEMHPYLQQRDWLQTNKNKGLIVIGYAPLGNTSPTYRVGAYANVAEIRNYPMMLENPVIKKVAQHSGCTPAQVTLQFNLKRGVTVIPKSVRPDHQADNWGALNCKLDAQDDADLKSMENRWLVRCLNICATFMAKCYEGLTGVAAWSKYSSPLRLLYGSTYITP